MDLIVSVPGSLICFDFFFFFFFCRKAILVCRSLTFGTLTIGTSNPLTVFALQIDKNPFKYFLMRRNNCWMNGTCKRCSP